MQRAAFAPDAGALDAVVRTRRSRIRSRRQPQSHIATACKCALVWKGVERRCALLAQSRAAPDRTSEEYMGSSFTAAERSLIAELSQVILPATDTPGAIEAGVPAFLEKIVFEWYSPGERRLFLAGLRELGEESSKRYKCDFAHCSSEQKQLLVRQLESAAKRLSTTLLDPPEQERYAFFTMLKKFVVIGYFSSEVGCTQALRYVPGPKQPIADYWIDGDHPQWS